MTPRPPAVLIAVVVAGCAVMHRPVEVDPDATFAAHQEHAALVVDRLERGRAGMLAPPGFLRLFGAPEYVLQVDGERVAAVWVAGSQAVVRQKPSVSSRLIGDVTPSWEDGAIRLALAPAGAPAFRTDPFARTSGGGGPPVLTRVAQTVIDVRGTYQATVRDAGGAAKGWMRARIGPYLPAPRIFEAALPPDVPPELVAGAAVALNAEIDWIEDHALNVYRGTGSDSLERSVPTQH
jgi:hypothetical protein